MSILTDISRNRKAKCTICGATETFYDTKNKIYKWYKSWVVGEPGFWCRRCYASIYAQAKRADERERERNKKW